MKSKVSVQACVWIKLSLAMFILMGMGIRPGETRASESFVIAASPSLKRVLEQLAAGFERSHPDVRVKLHFNTGLAMRQGIAGMQNSMVSRYFIEKGPIHLVAPGGDELIARLEMKYYVLPGTTRSYAKDQLVVVVPESLVEAPESLESLSRSTARLAIAESGRTILGKQTQQALRTLGLASSFAGRLDEATDSRGVVDHVLGGQADAGIVFGHEAVKEQDRLRVVAVIKEGYQPEVHSMAMERYCPNRRLCEEFLAYLQSAEAQSIVRRAGYGLPGNGEGPNDR
ncbi:MAG: Molybdenum ABC transporter, substrate-binding protein ModA [Nitrospira sp.]|jgi:molybdate transport system substrate-binding protein|nr:Molybdenum ABC transporter, substrate-binding protein ModA [Nitrospira sp.]